MNILTTWYQSLILTLSLVVVTSGQTIKITQLRVDDTQRMVVDTSSTDELMLSLMKLDDNSLNSSEATAVDLALLQAGGIAQLVEWMPSGLPKSFYRVEGSLLATYAGDTDGDGIDDQTEVQAKPFVHPIDATDAGNVDVFDITTNASITNGVPGIGAGNIEFANSADIYRFEVTSGTGIFINAISHAAPLGLHDYQLIDPYGSVVKASRFGRTEIGPVTLSFDGDYILLVGDDQESGTGSYSINLSVIPAPQTFEVNIGDVISDGQPAAGAGNIEAPAAFDIYTFDGTVAQRVFFDNLGSTGLSTLDYRLIAPDQTELFDTRFNLGDIGTLELPQTGNYTLEIGEADNDATGTYSIAIVEVPAKDSFAISIGDTIADGVPGAGAGNIETQGAFDEYTFEGTAGQKVFFDRLGSAGIGTVNYRLIAPDQEVLADTQFNFSDIGTLELPQTGTYTIEVGEADNDATGTYSIAIAEVPARDSFAISIGDTISDGVPGTGAGNIETQGAFDEYTFSGTVGQMVFFDKLSFTGIGTVNYRVIAPDQEVLADTQFNFSDIGTLELPQTGTYTIEVGEADNDATGTYSIAIIEVPAKDSFAISIGDTISDGVPGTGAGNIETQGAFDEYTFSGTTGQKVFVDKLAFTGVSSVNYRVIAPDQEVLADTQFNFSDIGTLELPQTGTYTIEVGEADNDATGTYSIAIVEVPAKDSFAISIGDTISDGVPGAGAGNIETQGAFDEYTFGGTVGQIVFIDNLGFSGLSTVNYKVIAPDQGELANTQFNFGDLDELELTQTGTYTIKVGEADNDSTGTYSLTIIEVLP